MYKIERWKRTSVLEEYVMDNHKKSSHIQNCSSEKVNIWHDQISNIDQGVQTGLSQIVL